MKKFLYLCVSLSVVSQSVAVMAADPCANWYAGQCVQHIKNRLGFRGALGNAKDMLAKANLPRTKVRVGDVAVFSYGHVAYVESIVSTNADGTAKRVKISEMNFGKKPHPTAPKQCLATDKYNVVEYRDINVTDAKFWRLSYKG
jgi:surface antigen